MICLYSDVPTCVTFSILEALGGVTAPLWKVPASSQANLRKALRLFTVLSLYKAE